MDEKETTRFKLTYLPLEVTLVAAEYAELPGYLGSTLRGVIGQMLYQTDREAYEFLYTNGKKTKAGQDTAKPYLIIPPSYCQQKIRMEKNEELRFDILLLGCAVQYAPVLVSALQKISHYGLGAQRCPFYLASVVHKQELSVIWRKNIYYRTGVSETPLPFHTLQKIKGVSVKLCTPLRIRRGGKLVTSISFPTLIRNITTRITALTQRYGGWADQEEIERIQKLALEIKTVEETLWVEQLERYSNRLQEKMDFSGLLGEMEFEGELTPFVPWFYAAQILHIGRNTTFGMGKIRVRFIPEV